MENEDGAVWICAWDKNTTIDVVHTKSRVF
jgi:hypothetical protein